MLTLAALLQQMRQRSDLQRIASNRAAQFGTPSRRYIGAELLPERPVNSNAYTEDRIRYRSVIANAGTRYSPTQKKGGVLVGSMDVKLAESDRAAEFTSEEYDALLRYLEQNRSMDATQQLIRFVDTQINIPLIEWIERARWQAIVSAVVQLRGDNEYAEDVLYSNPSGHRVAAAGAWSNDSVDPFDDIFAIADLLAGKGFDVENGRIITSRNVISIMAGNAIVQKRTSRVTVNNSGQLQGTAGRATRAQINAFLQEEGLPTFETYELRYTTNTGTGRFLPNNVMVFVGASGEQAEVDLGGDNIVFLENVLGYAAVGRAAGQAGPGRVIRAEAFENKPPRVEAEGWQTALPVIQEPEAIGVIGSIS